MGFIKKLEVNEGLNEELLKFKAYLELALHNLLPASQLFLELSSRYPTKTEYKTAQAFCFFRLGRVDEARAIFDSLVHQASGKALTDLVKAYYMIGDRKKSLDLIYKALQENDASAELYLTYIEIYTRCQQSDSGIIEAQHQVAFQKVITEYNGRFPERTEIKGFDIENGGLQEMLSITDSIAKRSMHAMDLYKAGSIPMRAISTITGKSDFDVWMACKSIQDVGIKISMGNEQEREREKIALQDSTAAVVDITTLFTLANIDQLELLSKCFSFVYIHQSTLDELTEQLSELETVAEHGQQIFVSNNGQYALSKITPEQTRKSAELLKKIKQFIIDSKVQVTGLAKQISDEDRQYIALSGDSTANSIALSEEKNSIFIIDDRLVRHFLTEKKQNVKTASTQSLLNGAADKKTISSEARYQSLLQLINNNYNYISINADMMQYCFEKDIFSSNNASLKSILETLTGTATEPHSIAVVIANFIQKIWMSSLLPQRKIFILDMILSFLNKNNNVRKIAPLILAELQPKFIFVPQYYEEINSYIRTQLSFLRAL